MLLLPVHDYHLLARCRNIAHIIPTSSLRAVSLSERLLQSETLKNREEKASATERYVQSDLLAWTKKSYVLAVIL